MKPVLGYVALCFALVGCGAAPTSVAPQAQPAQTTQPAQTARSVVSGASAQAQINSIRANAGLSAVRRDAQLDAAALAHARDMAAQNFMGHTGSDGSKVGQRVLRTGYRWCALAENVSQGYRSEARAIEGWRVSPAHYRNITNTQVTHFGIASVDGFRVMVVAARRC